jgi:hypothetical protein
MALYGKALADQIPASTTGNQARLLFGQMTSTLHNAYVTLQQYDSTGIGSKTGIDAGSVKAARQYLDDANGILQTYFLQMPASNSPLTADQLTKFKVAVSTSSAAVNYIDQNFGTGFLTEMFNNIGQALVAIPSAVVSKVGGGISDVVLSFLKQTWWILLLGGGAIAGFFYLQGRATSAIASLPLPRRRSPTVAGGLRGARRPRRKR